MTEVRFGLSNGGLPIPLEKSVADGKWHQAHSGRTRERLAGGRLTGDGLQRTKTHFCNGMGVAPKLTAHAALLRGNGVTFSGTTTSLL